MKQWMNKLPHLGIANGHLSMDGHDLQDIADRFATPLYVFSEKRIGQNVDEILSAFRAYHARTSLHYAAKSEATLAVLRAVKLAGSDLEVNSGGELYKGLKAGFRPDQIVFNGVAKSAAEITLAVENGIKAINVDSAFELRRIAQVAEKLNKKANIVLRFVPEVLTGVVKGNETGTHESKFGITSDEIFDLYDEAFANSFLNPVGMHMHIGTQTYDLNSFIDALHVMLEAVRLVYLRSGRKLELLNIGGGLPVPHFIGIEAKQYMPDNIYRMLRGDLSIIDIARAVAGELKPISVAAWAPDEADLFADCELLVEAGRKVVCDAGVLLSRVENEKIRREGDEKWLMIDAGFNTILETKTYKWYYHMHSINRADEPHVAPYKIAGPCCDSGDVHYDIDSHRDLPDYRLLPEGTAPGDLIALLNAGAYGVPNMSNYNGRPRAGVLMISKDGELKQVRRAENYDDLFRDEE